MANSNWKNVAKAKAIEKKNRERILKVNPNIEDKSGIYFLTRISEDGVRAGYIGQATKSVLTRLAQHLSGYQYIDNSIRAHGLYDEKENPYGYKINCIYYPVSELDDMEQHWILEYARAGYQMKNRTGGSQGKGKKQIAEYKPAKGYRDGIAQGRKSLARELSSIIDKHLVVSLKPNKANNKTSIKQFEKFKELLSEETYESKDQLL